MKFIDRIFGDNKNQGIKSPEESISFIKQITSGPFAKKLAFTSNAYTLKIGNKYYQVKELG